MSSKLPENDPVREGPKRVQAPAPGKVRRHSGEAAKVKPSRDAKAVVVHDPVMGTYYLITDKGAETKSAAKLSRTNLVRLQRGMERHVSGAAILSKATFGQDVLIDRQGAFREAVATIRAAQASRMRTPAPAPSKPAMSPLVAAAKARIDALPVGFTDWIKDLPDLPEEEAGYGGGDAEGPFAAPRR